MKTALILPILLAFAQLQQRIPQWVIINGSQAQAATVLQDGVIQSFNCPAPQPYTSTDGASTGWACFDPGTGTWLLNALPSGSPAYYYGFPGLAPYYYFPEHGRYERAKPLPRTF